MRALSRGWRKAVRTIAQLAAGGALTGLISAMAGGLPATTQGIVMAAWTALVAFAQNAGEAAGKIPVLLPTSGLVPTAGSVSSAVGTVDAAVTDSGEVSGTVTDTAGGVVGEVTGQLGYVDKPAGPPPPAGPAPEAQI